MEEFPIVIVGAGPSGLALGLALEKFKIPSLILEKDKDVTPDPRGVYLTGDAVRILNSVDIQEMHNIGHRVNHVHFHKSSFTTKEYLTLEIGTSNAYKQVVAEGLLQSQPKLELALRARVQSSEWCTLREGCAVFKRSETDPPIVDYVDGDNNSRQVKCEWLVGADGKTGVVRKHFLEPTAGIIQEDGTYPYSGTWVAANLKIILPTPETHPDFPLWAHGYSSDEVYDLFWPKDWHFCSPPGKPTATGRFGPPSDRTWRFEFCQDDWNDTMDAYTLMWDQLMPMITLGIEKHGEQFASPVRFPRDCIEVLRCRPFKFVHKVVNRWFHQRTILIGDAAHVFPPFAGQGIASGVRDAHQLAWRLALLVSSGSPESYMAQDVLDSWAAERRYSVDGAAMFSVANGYLVSNQASLLTMAACWLHEGIKSIPLLPNLPDPQGLSEAQGFTAVKGGFSSPGFRGGTRLAQIYIQSASSPRAIHSDAILHQSNTIFSLLITATEQEYADLVAVARTAISNAAISPSILSVKSIVVVLSNERTPSAPGPTAKGVPLYWPTSDRESCGSLPSGYDTKHYTSRIGPSTKFSIVRPDFYCFACIANKKDLVAALALLKGRLP